MTSFASALDLGCYLTGAVDLADLTPEFVAQATQLLELISGDIETAAGAPIGGGSSTVVLAGTWSRDLELPRGPITAVTAVTLNGQTLDAAGYWWNERNLIRRGIDSVNASTNAGDDIDDGTVDQGAVGRYGIGWGGPEATVVVDWTYEFAAVPGSVKSLALRIAARTIGNPQQVSQESLGPYSVSLGDAFSRLSNDSGLGLTKIERMRLRRLFNRTGGSILPAGR